MKRKHFLGALFVLLAGFLPARLAAQSVPQPGNPVPGRTKTQDLRLVDSYGRLPLRFEANKGQTDSRVKFLSRGAGQTLFLTSHEVVLVLSKPLDQKPARSEFARLSLPHSSRSAVLRMRLLGANSLADVIGLETLPGTSNYFIGNDPTRWRTNLPTYGKVRYNQIYPGVDLLYYGNQRELEYDFVVAPGADTAQIRLAIQGAEKISIDATGDAVLHRKDGDVRLQRPRLYQEVRGQRIDVSGGYALKGNELRFAVARYDHSQALVIDPVLAYSTYLGGNGIDLAKGIAVDASGNAYVAGYTASTNFPVGSASIQSTYGGGIDDVFVAKLDPTGSTLLYSTYLGGSGDDVANGIAVDSAGNAYVTGTTLSSNFPLSSSPIQSTKGSSGDAFIAKLNAGGNALVYSTYLGGSGIDAATAIAVDSSGNAYVTGLTSSIDFPGVSANSFQSTNASGGAAFVTELNAAGTALVYSTYLGGSSGSNGAYGIAVDSSGNAYVTGQTSSSDFPGVNSSSIQPASGGAGDAYVAKLNAAGTALVYSTYLGGSGFDIGLGIALDSSGSAYVTGYTNSSNFPGATSSSIQAANAGGYDGFVAKLNAAGTMLVYSTYLGGSGTDTAAGIAVNSSGNAYVTGGTTSTNFPGVNPNSIQPANGGLADAFVAQLNAAGTALVYSTYLGGSGNDVAASIAVDSSGNVYVAGYTGSTNFPLGSSPVQSTYGGGTYDAFVAKLSSANPGAATVTALVASVNPSVIGQQVSLTATVIPTSTSSLTPGGNVTFSDGSTVLGTTSLTSGTAIFNTLALAVGSHSITASYAGDSNFAASTSTALSQTVNQGTSSATVIASPNPGVAGQSMTLTGIITAVAPASGTPTGTVTFLDGTKTLGLPAALIGGQATLTISSITAGSHSITATYAGDNSFLGNASAATALIVSQPLAITSLNQTTFTSGNAGSFTVTTTGFPSPSLSESGTLPVGVNFVDNGNGTATLSGTPGANAGGTYPITLTAHNGVGPNAAQNFTLIVNQPPAITSVNQTTFPLGTANSFSVVAAGFPTPSISESGALPGGVTFNGVTGALSGTPAAGTSGTYTITFVAHNGVGPDAVQTFMLTVSPSAAFTSVSLTTFTVGTAGSFTVTATGSPTPNLSEKGTLPSGVTFNSGTGVLSGTPAAGTGGTYPITFTAHNGVAPDATQSFTLTVSQASAITSVNQTVFMFGNDGSFTFTVSATGFPVPSFSESGALPVGVTFNSGTGTLSGMPPLGAVGTYPITFTAHNGVGPDATQSFTLTVALTPSTTTIVSSSNPSLSAQTVNFTVSISLGFPVAIDLASSVVVSVDGGIAGNAGIIPGGSFTGSPNQVATVTLPIVILPSGAHTVTALFVPGNHFISPSSSSMTQTVNPIPSAMTLSSSSNPSLFNQALTITATITSTVPIPTGFSASPGGIAFQIDGGNIFIVPAVDFAGTTVIVPINTLLLSPGAHTITAAYRCGPVDCMFAPNSASLTQTVNNTPVGMQVAVSPVAGGTGLTPVSLVFSSVTQLGITSLSVSSTGQTPPASFQLGNPPVYYSLSTTASFTGSVTICINYSGIAFTQPPQLFHFQNGTWLNITTSVDTNNMVVCGLTNSFSPFALFQPSVNPTTTSISAPGVTYGTPASVTVSVVSSTGTVTGNVILSIDGGAPSTIALFNGSAIFNLGVLNAGSHSLSAGFAAQGSFASSSAVATLSVAQARLTIAANNAARPYGANNPVLTGTILGLQNGDPISASFTTTATPASPVGTYPIMPTLAGAPNVLGNYTVALVNGTLAVVPETTSLSVAISPLSIAVGQSTTVTVTLTAPDMVIPIDPSVLASVAVTSPIVSDILTTNGACALAPAGTGIATCSVTLTAVEPNGRTLNASFPGTANLAASNNLANLIVTAPLESKVSCLKSDFRNVAVPGGSYLWLNSIFKIRDVNKQKVTITFFQSSVQFQYRDASNNLISVNQALPDAKITIDPSVSLASTMFDAVDNVWITTVPFDLDDATFLTGIPWLVPAGGIPADIEPVTWCGTFASDTAGVDMGWRWSAAAYSSFSGDNTALGVKPMNTDHDNPPANRDNAGTPENFKPSVIPGARGKGAKNYTGSYSGSAEIE